MNLFKKIRPKNKLKYLSWYDLLIITVIMFGQFIVTSTELLIKSLNPASQFIEEYADTVSSSDGAAFSSNFTLQVVLLILALIYLFIRNFDFKQLKIKFKPSVLIWVVLMFIIVGLFGDFITTVSGEYNYFNPELMQYINPLEIINKFMTLSPMAIIYSLLNGFYEEFFFLGLMTSVKGKYKRHTLAFSTLIRISFHTYQGILWAMIIGIVYGLFYYFMYKRIVKNLLPFFLMHALTDMFGSTFLYLLISWNY